MTSRWGLVAVLLGTHALAQWSMLPSMSVPRRAASGVYVPDAGVLIAGGNTGGSSYTASSQLFANGAWSDAGTMANPRHKTAMVLMPNNEVLYLGGYNGTTTVDKAELWNPESRTWRDAGTMQRARDETAAVVMPDASVLVSGKAGGEGTFTERYTTATAFQLDVPLTIGRSFHVMAVLPDDSVLVVGGRDNTKFSLNSVERFANGVWTVQPPLSIARQQTTGTLLTDGRLLIAGGSAAVAPQASAEVYDPTTSAWTTVAPMTVRRTAHCAVRLPDGTVLVTGGVDGPLDVQGMISGTALSSCERYLPATNEWVDAGSMAIPRWAHVCVGLPNGDVLVAGGQTTVGNTATAELLSFTPLATGGGMGTMNGTGGNGASSGGAGGGGGSVEARMLTVGCGCTSAEATMGLVLAALTFRRRRR